METKQLVIDALNGALQFYAENGGRVHFPEDRVIDYNVETSKIASFIDRHPGWIKLSVSLIEGGGIYFIRSVQEFMYSSYEIAWEEDNGHHGSLECFKKMHPDMKKEDRHQFNECCRAINKELSTIIRKIMCEHS